MSFPEVGMGLPCNTRTHQPKNIKQKNTRAKIKKSIENLWKQIYMEEQQTREKVKDVFPNIKIKEKWNCAKRMVISQNDRDKIKQDT